MARRIEVALKSRGHGKLVRACVLAEGDRASSVTYTGDFFLEPAELLEELNHAMSGATIAEAADRAAAFFGRQTHMMLLGATPEDFAALVVKALER